MIQNQVKAKEQKYIQLEVPIELHNNIIKCQGLYFIQGKKLTVPNTCLALIELATNHQLKSINNHIHE